MPNAKPKVYIFYCAATIEPAALEADISRKEQELKFIPLPCSGKLDILYLTKAFETGADAAVVILCKEGECRYLEGNSRARKRAQAVDSLLQETGLGTGRVSVLQMDDSGLVKIERELCSFLDGINAQTSSSMVASS